MSWTQQWSSTDSDYLHRANELAHERFGEDLLLVPTQSPSRTPSRIAIRTPGLPDAPHRGGTPQMIRRAGELKFYVFQLELFRGLVFVFDHDDEGLRARDQIGTFWIQARHQFPDIGSKASPCRLRQEGSHD